MQNVKTLNFNGLNGPEYNMEVIEFFCTNWCFIITVNYIIMQLALQVSSFSVAYFKSRCGSSSPSKDTYTSVASIASSSDSKVAPVQRHSPSNLSPKTSAERLKEASQTDSTDSSLLEVLHCVLDG